MRAWCNKFFYSIIRLCRRDMPNISKCQQRGVKGCRQTAERDHPCRNEYNVRKTAKRRSIAKESQKEQDGHQRCPSNHTRYCNVISVLEVIKFSGQDPEWFSQCPGITASHHWGWEFDVRISNWHRKFDHTWEEFVNSLLKVMGFLWLPPTKKVDRAGKVIHDGCFIH